MHRRKGGTGGPHHVPVRVVQRSFKGLPCERSSDPAECVRGASPHAGIGIAECADERVCRSPVPHHPERACRMPSYLRIIVPQQCCERFCRLPCTDPSERIRRSHADPRFRMAEVSDQGTGVYIRVAGGKCPDRLGYEPWTPPDGQVEGIDGPAVTYPPQSVRDRIAYGPGLPPRAPDEVQHRAGIIDFPDGGDSPAPDLPVSVLQFPDEPVQMIHRTP